MLYADRSTCNGVVPHPYLPLFITYGIDSTAKLWRGTIPVDDEYDDSFEVRRRWVLSMKSISPFYSNLIYIYIIIEGKG